MRSDEDVRHSDGTSSHSEMYLSKLTGTSSIGEMCRDPAKGTSYPLCKDSTIYMKKEEMYRGDMSSPDVEDMSTADASRDEEMSPGLTSLGHPAIITPDQMPVLPHEEELGVDEMLNEEEDTAGEMLDEGRWSSVLHSFRVNIWCGASRHGFAGNRATFFLHRAEQDRYDPQTRLVRNVDFRVSPQRWLRDTLKQRKGQSAGWYHRLAKWGKDQPRFTERTIGTLNRRTKTRGIVAEECEAAGLDFLTPVEVEPGEQQGVVELWFRAWRYRVRVHAPRQLKAGGGRVMWLTGEWNRHGSKPESNL